MFGQAFLRARGAVDVDRVLGYRLCSAAAAGDAGALAQLEGGGASLNTADYDCRTALHLAASNGHLGTVRWLLGRPGVRLEPVDRFFNTPADDARRHQHRDVHAFLHAAAPGAAETD